MGVSRSASSVERSNAGALKASLTPSNNPMFRLVALLVVDDNFVGMTKACVFVKRMPSPCNSKKAARQDVRNIVVVIKIEELSGEIGE